MKEPIPPERVEEQRALRDILARVRKRHGLKWLSFWKEVVGIEVGIDFEKNFNTGQVGLETAARIKDWIIAHELELASKHYPHYFPRSLTTDWQGFIDEVGQYGSLHIQPYSPTQLHEISNHHPISETRIRLGQEFTFELDSPIFGALIGLARYKGEWYPLSLRDDGSFDPIAIKNGLYGFPTKGGNPDQIIPMRQRSYAGEHGHCFIIGPIDLMRYYTERFQKGKALPLTFLNDMAQRLQQLESHKLSIHLENVIFE